MIADSDANLIERVLYQQKVKNDNGRLVKRLALSGKKNANYYLFYRVKTLRQRHQASFNYNFGIMVSTGEYEQQILENNVTKLILMPEECVKG